MSDSSPKTILIANRGEIAARAIRTVHQLGMRAVAVYSDPDAGSPHVEAADEAYRLGPGPVSESYLLQDRLLEIGKWLKINGEAIYGSRRWDRLVQWSEGERDYKPEGQHYLGADFILKQTVDPEPGYAVKEMFFTHNDGAIYAILPKWPEGKITVKDFTAE